ncbi:MAG: hypothetical protein FWD99_00090 [Oscillospiraceae bacterium]|nr:hypothetical protein [Oscillospiraceae bacterium]
MNKMDLWKGIGIGLGIVAGCGLKMFLCSRRRKLNKKKHDAVRAFGQVVDNVTEMFGF